MSKNKRVSKQGNNMSDRHKKRHVDRNELDSEDRCDRDEEQNRI